MRTNIFKRRIQPTLFSITASVIFTLLVVTFTAYGASTISSNIATGGTLGVTGLSTFTGGFISAASSTVSTGGLAVTGALTASTSLMVGTGNNATSISGMVAGFCTIPATTITPTTSTTTAGSTALAACAGATGVTIGDRVFITATSSMSNSVIIGAASSTGADTITVLLINLATSTVATGINSFNFWAVR